MFRLRQLVTFRYPGPIKVLTLGLVPVARPRHRVVMMAGALLEAP